MFKRPIMCTADATESRTDTPSPRLDLLAASLSTEQERPATSLLVGPGRLQHPSVPRDSTVRQLADRLLDAFSQRSTGRPSQSATRRQHVDQSGATVTAAVTNRKLRSNCALILHYSSLLWQFIRRHRIPSPLCSSQS